MKLGLIEIETANFGNIGLTGSNAFIGTTNLIQLTADDRLRFVAGAASSFYLEKKSTLQTAQYSTDGTTWTDIPTSSANAVQMASGDIVYIRGKLTSDVAYDNYTKFKMTGSIAAKGNINYIWDYENLNAPLKEYCGEYMFMGCTALTSAPELPSTTLVSNCYVSMFNGCTSLTSAPELPATTLTFSCYNGMFNGCTGLTTTPVLPATTLALNCYLYMFMNCTSLTTATNLPATTLANYCYYSMFLGCTSLTSAPELSATTLPLYSYSKMFNGCRNLSYIKCLATNISGTGCLNNWVSNVSATGTFVKAASMSSWPTGANGIPSDWTVQDA